MSTENRVLLYLMTMKDLKTQFARIMFEISKPMVYLELRVGEED